MATSVVSNHPAEPVPDAALLGRHDEDGLRYACYPGVERFSDRFGADEYRRALLQRAQVGARAGAALALHLRLPAAALCGDASGYAAALGTELALLARLLGGRRTLTRLHLGGAALDAGVLERLLQRLHRHFALAPTAECSVEVDVGSTGAQHLQRLAELGFNRLGFTWHDGAPARTGEPAGPRAVERLLEAARLAGFTTTGVVLMRDAPGQTPAGFAAKLEHLLRWRPERIALWRWRPVARRSGGSRAACDRALPQAALVDRAAPERAPPDAAERGAPHAQATALLLGAGYRHLGLDCYAVPQDALALAKRHGWLHRNPLGYSAQPAGDLLGLGVATISKVGAVYSQNAASCDAYRAALGAGELPVRRGVILDREDLLRRAVISALLCQGELDYESFEVAHLIDFRRHFGAELARLEPYADAGLVTSDAEGLQVTPLGCHVVGAIAAVFDAYRPGC